jgi:UPF0716 family protein affecting phage T7 exclusion
MDANTYLKTLWAKARHIVREIRAGDPGSRFMDYWYARQSRERESPARRAAFIALGVFLIIAGIVLGPTPIIPGFLVGIPGLAILAARLRIIARMLDKGELVLRSLARLFQRGRR